MRIKKWELGYQSGGDDNENIIPLSDREIEIKMNS